MHSFLKRRFGTGSPAKPGDRTTEAVHRSLIPDVLELSHRERGMIVSGASASPRSPTSPLYD